MLRSIFKKPIHSSFIVTAVGCAAILFLLTGCKDSPQIVTHRVPKSQSGLEGIRPLEDSSSSGSPAPASSMPTPEGWNREKSNPMFPSDKFSKTVDNNEVILSVMSLPSSNDWQSNVVRWLGQVDMTKTPEEIDELTTEVKVDGKTSQKIRLFKDDDDSTAIVGAMAVKGNLAWFIKLTGKKPAVVATEKEFDDFLKSFKFP